MNELASVTTTPSVPAPIAMGPISAAVSGTIVAVSRIDIVGTRIHRRVAISISVGPRMYRYVAISGARNEDRADARSDHHARVSLRRTRQSQYDSQSQQRKYGSFHHCCTLRPW